MNALIIGAAGMIGRKLTTHLLSETAMVSHPLQSLHLVDVVPPEAMAHTSCTVTGATADLSLPGVADTLIEGRPGLIFHLAAIVSGEAEADFEKGYRINLDGTLALFEAIRKAHEQDGYCPRVVFTSSIAVFGAPFPTRIGDDFATTPLTSYGTQKAIGELLLSDYTRKGYFDGVGLRLPTICIRPGKPNAAASSFFSGILREPINGVEAILPVSDKTRHWFASPRAAIRFLAHAATLDGALIGARRNLSLPGLSATVGEQIASLERVVGSHATKLIKHKPDPTIESIVCNWAEDFDTPRARDLGFVSETSFDDIIQVYLDDEMQG